MRNEQRKKPNGQEQILEESEHLKVKEKRRNWKGDWEGKSQTRRGNLREMPGKGYFNRNCMRPV